MSGVMTIAATVEKGGHRNGQRRVALGEMREEIRQVAAGARRHQQHAQRDARQRPQDEDQGKGKGGAARCIARRDRPATGLAEWTTRLKSSARRSSATPNIMSAINPLSNHQAIALEIQPYRVNGHRRLLPRGFPGASS